MDQRFIIKKVTKIEFDSFLEFAPLYFGYLSKVSNQNVPSALAKIVGVYTTLVTTKKGLKKKPKHLVVMENLFLGRKISKVFDLKGSQRARKATTELKDNNVLLDENLLERAPSLSFPSYCLPSAVLYARPLCVDQESKSHLGVAVWNDSLFLASLNVMDYSLLVGIDDATGEYVCGIIGAQTAPSASSLIFH